jgi:hypothetical protein
MAVYANTAITFGNLKGPLIYYDHVVPVFYGGMGALPHIFEAMHLGSWGEPLPDVLPIGFGVPDVYPPALRDNADFHDRLWLVNGYVAYLAIRATASKSEVDWRSDEENAWSYKRATTAFYEFVNEFSLGKLPLDFGNRVKSQVSDESEPESDTVISLASLDLIDTERASWEQIREFRRDIEAHDKLRRLRLFAYANYQGKSKDFVEDDILTRIADYEAAVKKWGFETAQGALNMLLTSKVIGGALAGSLVSTLFGAPTIAVVAAASGGALEVGRISLEITKQRLALRSLMRENPVSFISYAREKLQDGSQT